MDHGEPIPKRRGTFNSGSADEKAVQVVGFHIEGEEEEACASASSSLLGGQGIRGGGSPMPVTIPPTFKGQKPHVNLVPPRVPEGISGTPPVSRAPVSGLRREGIASELTRQITPREGDLSGLKPILTGRPNTSQEKEAGVSNGGAEVGVIPQRSTEATHETNDKRGKGRKAGGKEGQKDGGGEGGGSDQQKQKPGKKGQQQQGAKGGKEKGGKEKGGGGGKTAGEALVVTSSTSLFDHLQQYKKVSREELLRRPEIWDLNPAVVKLGVEFIEGHKTGGLLRCRAMLEAFRTLVNDYKRSEGVFDPMDFLPLLNQHIGFLVECRPLNVTMKNAIRYLKVQISKLKAGVPLEEGKDGVVRLIDTYMSERINVGHIIAKEACSKVRDGDVILMYSPSQAVMHVLLHAWTNEMKRFKVIVVESRPKLVGRKVVSQLVGVGIPCSYIYMNAISFMMPEVNTVFMGASAVLMNGTVVSRVGSAGVAMMAHANHVPVVICAETCKFHEQVQLNSFTQNELGDPYELQNVEGHPELKDLAGWEQNRKLDPLNLKYDVMPAKYVAMIATELGIMPTTSVPVILRETVTNDKEVE
ncbi:hypothetical protein BSKO_07702 [Bryopsis sp. KO-2023]|nr:hypothetical protein BSKO_07702 [Bryopsis sp. KO-2023]